MGRDCLWDNEDQPRECAQLIRVSLYYGMRLPLEQQGATQRRDCTADLLLPSLWDKTASGTGRSIFFGDLMLRKLEQRIRFSVILNILVNLRFVGPLGLKGSY